MTTFLALYRGNTVAEAQMVAVSAEPNLIAFVARRLLKNPQDNKDDPAIAALESGRRGALQIIKREATHEPA